MLINAQTQERLLSTESTIKDGIFTVPARQVNSRDFFRSANRSKNMAPNEILLVTHKHAPVGFVTTYSAEKMISLGLTDSDLQNFQIGDFRDGIPADANQALLDTRLSDTKNVFWNLSTFLDLAENNPAISIAPETSYYIRNHLEKPFYSGSPKFDFSNEGFLAEYASMFSRFSGPTALIVNSNKLPIKVVSDTDSKTSALILPATQEVKKLLEQYKQEHMTGAFYVDFPKRMRDGLEQNTIYSGHIYEFELMIIPMDEDTPLRKTVLEIARALPSKADSIPRRTYNPRGTQENDNPNESVSDAIPLARCKSSPEKISMNFPEDAQAVKLSLSELATLSTSLRQAFNAAEKNESLETKCRIGNTNLRVSTDPKLLTMLRFMEDQKIGATHITHFNGAASNILKNPEALQTILNLKNRQDCLIIDGQKPLVIMPENSAISTICDSISQLSQD